MTANVLKNDKRQQLAQITAARQAFWRMKRGASAILHDYRKGLLLVAALAVFAAFWIFRYQVLGYGPDAPLHSFFDFLVGATVVVFAVATPFILSWVWGAPLQAGEVQANLQRIGFVNSAGEYPYLLTETEHPNNPNVSVYEFFSCGLTVHEWLESINAVQSAVNRTIADIRTGKDNQHVLVSVGPPSFKWPEQLVWLDRMVDYKNFVLTLGVSPLGPVTVDLTSTPHVLLGGSTGSGKTILLKVLLRQAIGKFAEVFIADFKGCVDFSGRFWREHCHMDYDLDSTQATLNNFMTELDRRQKLLYEAECANIDDYNIKLGPNGHRLRRIIFATDEAAAMLDKTGQSKERKAQLDEVSWALSEIACKGRALGLHLFLSTQRPDANVIPSQVRSNVEFRVCGRADKILSDIVIGSTAAADLIPKDSKGRFVLNDGRGEDISATVFQAYILPDDLH